DNYGATSTGPIWDFTIVSSIPIADFSYSPSKPWTGDLMQFHDLSQGENIKSWLWNFGDGTTSSEQNPKHIYSTAGKYTVTLKITDMYNTIGTTSKILSVSNPKKPGDAGVINVALKSNGAIISGSSNFPPYEDLNLIIDGSLNTEAMGGYSSSGYDIEADVTLGNYADNYRLIGIGWKIQLNVYFSGDKYGKIAIADSKGTWYQIATKDLSRGEEWNTYNENYYVGPLPQGFTGKITKIALIGAKGDYKWYPSTWFFYEVGVWIEPYDNLIVTGYCPIDLTIIDPDGYSMNKTFSEIPNSQYIEDDFNDDGTLDDRIIIQETLDGGYSIIVNPEQYADINDTFSLYVNFKGEEKCLAENMSIKDIPESPYVLGWPEKPDTPSGATNCKKNIKYIYTTRTIDPDNDDVYYMWDWGDGNFSDWIGPYKSGENCSSDHIWSENGEYSIRVKAKDSNNFTGEWSDPLEVSMTKSKEINISLFLQKLFQRFPFFEKILNQYYYN
ncbi:MAG: PKD domain-containing protein, partial [Candidatus Thermoplasmatota archaeon]|nr:PKD domain-containing protein [Candidatus Thermoplasmatota archaeon]